MRRAAALGAALALGGCGFEEVPTGGFDGSPRGAAAEALELCENVERPGPSGVTEWPAPATGDAGGEIGFVTSCGSFTVEVSASGEAAAALLERARDGFYDGAVVGRALPGILVQLGDPADRGDPPYPHVTPAEQVGVASDSGFREPRAAVYLVPAAYPTGHGDIEGAGAELVFIVGTAAEPAGFLTRVGTVTEGMETLDRIAALATEDPRRLLEPVVILGAEVRE